MIYKEFSFGGKKNPFGSFGAIIAMIAVLLLLFFIAKGIFTILSWAAPVLLILAAVFDYTVITDYLKFIGKLFKENPLFGIIASILTVFGFPVVAGFLFFRAFARKSLKNAIKKAEEKQKPKFTEYEEVEDDDIMILPKVERQQNNTTTTNKSNDYDELFK